MKRKFRLQIIEQLNSGEIIVLSEGVAELATLELKKDFGVDTFQLMAEHLLKEVENKKNTE
jgi:hypothetical protein